MAGDRNFSKGGVEVSFFDQPTVLSRGPAALSLRSGSPLIMVFLVREPSGRLCLFFEPPLFPKEGGSFRENLLAMTQEIASLLERQIRKDPSQWLVFQPFWNSK